MRKIGKKGFTLTELIVVLVIMGLIAAIAVPLFTNYWRKAEFRKNEENAKTVYLAAESKLTWASTPSTPATTGSGKAFWATPRKQVSECSFIWPKPRARWSPARSARAWAPENC